jgi:hypothetical protein
MEQPMKKLTGTASPCERCGKVCAASDSGRRRRCAICMRLICRACMHLPRMTDEAVMCAARDENGSRLPDDCREPRAEAGHTTARMLETS